MEYSTEGKRENAWLQGDHYHLSVRNVPIPFTLFYIFSSVFVKGRHCLSVLNQWRNFIIVKMKIENC